MRVGLFQLTSCSKESKILDEKCHYLKKEKKFILTFMADEKQAPWG